MSYVKLALIKDDPDFIAAAKSMGWTDEDYIEIINELGEVDAHIVNYDEVRVRPRGTYGEVEVYFTIGSSEGNRWYSAGTVAVIVNNAGTWAKLETIDAICC